MIILLILKGFIIGIGKVLPGISGSVLAISMGIYDKIIDAFSNFFKDVKKNFLFLIQILIGISIAIIIGSKVINYFINHFYTLTMFTILGFIVGTIPSLINKTKYNKKNFILSIISFLVTFFLNNFLKFNISINAFSTVLFGLIEAFTSIVPGISGTAIFINLGVYTYILNGISSIDFNFLVFYVIGALSGLIIFSKIINFFLKKRENEFEAIINGLVIASVFSIFSMCINESSQMFLGSILFIITTTISYLNT